LKNGKEDLEKAIHFLQKLIELEYPEENCVPETEVTLTFAPDYVSEKEKDYVSQKMEWAKEVARSCTGVPDHLKEFIPTERQKEVAAKFEDLRLKNEAAFSPMLIKFLKDSGEPLPEGYVDQDR
jgi:hypothetical protein